MPLPSRSRRAAWSSLATVCTRDVVRAQHPDNELAVTATTMRTTRVKTALALAYLALLLWFGDAGIGDDPGIEVALVSLTWLNSSMVVE